jgi:hypothetical protein
MWTRVVVPPVNVLGIGMSGAYPWLWASDHVALPLTPARHAEMI